MEKSKYLIVHGKAEGVWHVTGNYTKENAPDMTSCISMYRRVVKKYPYLRPNVRQKLKQMGVSHIPCLQPNQVKTFYKFLKSLENEKLQH